MVSKKKKKKLQGDVQTYIHKNWPYGHGSRFIEASVCWWINIHKSMDMSPIYR